MQAQQPQNAFNKNMAKKTGKNTPTPLVNSNDKVAIKNASTSVPNSKQFMDEYEQTLLRNQQIDWLNGNNDSFISTKKEEKKEEKPKASTAQIPSFWKKDVSQVEAKSQGTANNTNSNYQQKLQKARFSFIQKSSTDSPSNNCVQPDSTNKSNSASSKSQDQPIQSTPTNKQVDTIRSQRQPVAAKPKQTQTIDLTSTTINNSKSNQSSNTPALVPQDGNNNIFNKESSSFSQPNNEHTVSNQPYSNNAQSISVRPANFFNNNNQIGQSNKTQSNNLGSSNQIFQNNTQQVTVPKQINTPNFNGDLSKAGFKRETWTCALPYMQNAEWLEHRNSLANNLKNKSTIDEKMIDMLAVITFSENKAMAVSQIEQKRLPIKTFALSFEQAKEKQSEPIMKQVSSVQDRQTMGYALKQFLPAYQRLTPKTIKYNSQQELNELLKDQAILKYYKSIENQIVQSFLQHYQHFYQKSYHQFQNLTARMFKLIEERKMIEAQLCQLRQQKKQGQVSGIFNAIQERQQSILALLYKVVDRLGSNFENLPKSDLNYELQDINKLEEQQKLLIQQIESCSKGLVEVKEGCPYKQTTDLLCECTSYLAQRVAHIQQTIMEIQQRND